MGKMIVAKCSICGQTFRSRSRTASIRKIGEHWRKRHPNALSRRIKTGKRKSEDNPGIQDFITALKESPRNAIRIYSKWTERQFRTTKKYMNALEDILPEGINASWKLIEVLHDEVKI